MQCTVSMTTDAAMRRRVMGLGAMLGDEKMETCLRKGELVRVQVQRLIRQRCRRVLASHWSRVCKGRVKLWKEEQKKTKTERWRAKTCSSSILACWTHWGSNCVTGSADRFSTWLQRHHVVVTLGDAAHSGGASQAQAQLPGPAALALHPCIKRSVEPNRKIKQTLFVKLACCKKWWKYGRGKKILTSWLWYRFHTWRSGWWSPTWKTHWLMSPVVLKMVSNIQKDELTTWLSHHRSPGRKFKDTLITFWVCDQHHIVFFNCSMQVSPGWARV